MKPSSQLLLSFVVLCTLLPSASAHVDGLSFERESDAFFVDIGFDQPLQVGEATMFDFSLTKLSGSDKGAGADFDSVIARLLSGSVIQSEEQAIKPAFGKTTLTMTPKVGGLWSFSVQYFKKGRPMITEAFPVVIETFEARGLPPWMYGIASVSIVAACFVAFRLRSSAP